MKTRRVLIAVENADFEGDLRKALGNGPGLTLVRDRRATLEALKHTRYDGVLFDLNFLALRPSAGLEAVRTALAPFLSAAALIVVSRPAELSLAIKAVRCGADDTLLIPADPESVRWTLQAAIEERLRGTELDYLRSRFWRTEDRVLVTTRVAAMRDFFAQVETVAPTDLTLLLGGETGTGKSSLAKLVHRHSKRSEGPFVDVHCGTIPEHLIESTLFGHEKGAFTGASQRQLGYFEVADGGTIFLDEIGTISAAAQIRLLRVLQEGIFRRLGGEREVSVDVRVIAASNENLAHLVAEGRFRRDLFYRLNVFSLELPPLRDRLGDLPNLIHEILKGLDGRHARGIREADPGCLEALTLYPWPGNIRELENVLGRAYLLETGEKLSAANLPPEIAGQLSAGSQKRPLAEIRRRAVVAAERAYLAGLLTVHGGRIGQAASAAEITPRQFLSLLKRTGLRKEDFKITPRTRHIDREGSRNSSAIQYNKSHSLSKGGF